MMSLDLAGQEILCQANSLVASKFANTEVFMFVNTHDPNLIILITGIIY